MTQSTNPDALALTTLHLLGPDPRTGCRTGPASIITSCIVGGGQTGCALAFALRRAGIGKVTVIDAAPDETRAGIWLNAARMNLLRTPKGLVGAGTRHSHAQLPGLVRGAARRRRLCRDRPHPAHRMGGVSELVQAVPEDPGPLRHPRDPDRTGGDRFRLHLDIGGEARVETTRKIVLAPASTASAACNPVGADRKPARDPLRPHRGCDRFRRAARQDRGGDRRRGVGVRCGRRGVGARRGRGASVRPPAGRSPPRRSPARAAFPAPTTIIPICRTRRAGTRRSGSAASARRRPRTRSSAR